MKMNNYLQKYIIIKTFGCITVMSEKNVGKNVHKRMQ